MDYYSNYPGPTREEAIDIMIHKFDKVKNIENYATLFVDDEIRQYGGLGSYTGWYVSVKNSIETKIMYVYYSQIKKQKAMNKFKILALFIGVMKCKKIKNKLNRLKRKYESIYY